MSVAPYRPKIRKNPLRQSQRLIHRPRRNTLSDGKPMPLVYGNVQSSSVQLRALLALQKRSSIVASGLVLLAIATYGWTVWVPNIWSQEYRKMRTLERQERQLTQTNEAMKHQLSQQAERSGLLPVNPHQSIFLSPPTPSSTQPQQPATARPTFNPPSVTVAY